MDYGRVFARPGMETIVLEDVTFAQLRTFACAARASSFADAADQLDISQPSVSEQVKILEGRLGCRLFRRRRGTTPVLTSEGEEALEEVEKILAASRNLFKLGRKSADKVLLRISVGPYLAENYLRRLIPRIYREYPNVQIDLQPLVSSTEVTQLVESGELELAVYAEPTDADLQPYSRLICELSMVVIAPPGTRARLAAGECALEDFQFIFPGRREISARWARQCLRDLQLAPSAPTIFVDFVDALAQLVEDGKGIGRTMRYAVQDRIDQGRIEALDIPLPPIRRLVVRSPSAPPEARAIEDMLCQALTV